MLDGNTVAGNKCDRDGGGIGLSEDLDSTITNNTVVGNVSGPKDDESPAFGGGINVGDTSKGTIIGNNLIIGNRCVAADAAGQKAYGGGLMVWFHSHATVINNTIAANRLVSANSQAVCGGAGIALYLDGTATVTNSIIWGNEIATGSSNYYDQIRLLEKYGFGSTLEIDYSDVMGGEEAAVAEEGCTLNWGDHNIDDDPEFADPGEWQDTEETPSDPTDDVWVNGDYHLKSKFGRWDPAAKVWVFTDYTVLQKSPCIDAGNPADSYSLETACNGGRINMGRYGNTSEASRSHGWPTPGDCTFDCRVNILDLIYIRNKLNQPVGVGDNWKADVNADTKINILDLIFVRSKLNTRCPAQ